MNSLMQENEFISHTRLKEVHSRICDFDLEALVEGMQHDPAEVNKERVQTAEKIIEEVRQYEAIAGAFLPEAAKVVTQLEAAVENYVHQIPSLLKIAYEKFSSGVDKVNAARDVLILAELTTKYNTKGMWYQEKKVKLAKTYLKEIERKERKRIRSLKNELEKRKETIEIYLRINNVEAMRKVQACIIQEIPEAIEPIYKSYLNICEQAQRKVQQYDQEKRKQEEKRARTIKQKEQGHFIQRQREERKSRQLEGEIQKQAVEARYKLETQKADAEIRRIEAEKDKGALEERMALARSQQEYDNKKEIIKMEKDLNYALAQRERRMSIQEHVERFCLPVYLEKIGFPDNPRLVGLWDAFQEPGPWPNRLQGATKIVERLQPVSSIRDIEYLNKLILGVRMSLKAGTVAQEVKEYRADGIANKALITLINYAKQSEEGVLARA